MIKFYYSIQVLLLPAKKTPKPYSLSVLKISSLLYIILSYQLEHILFQRFIIRIRNSHLFSGIFQSLHLLKFLLSILKFYMGVDIERHSYIRMSHQILQCFRIHAGLCHIGTICMSANMRGNIGHLNLIDFIVPADHMIEPVFPMHGYKWHSILVQKKESRVTIYHFLNLIIWSILNNCSKHLRHFICHWNNPCSGIGFCWLNYILSFGSSLQLIWFFYCSFNLGTSICTL